MTATIEKSGEELNLAFGGDFSPSCEYSRKPSLAVESLRNIREHIAKKSVLFLNLECAAPTSEKKSHPTRCSVKSLGVLEAAKPAVVNMANNHCFDAGEKEFNRFRSALKELGIPIVGIYKRGERAVDFLKIDTSNVGIISRVAKGTNPSSWGSKYFIEKLVPAELLHTCKKIRSGVDMLIVSLHWGAEYYTAPSPWQRSLVADLLAEGVDVVWGHHAHALQPRLVMGERLVAYNLGNLLFGSSFIMRWPSVSRKSSVVEFRKDSQKTVCNEALVRLGTDGRLHFVGANRRIRAVRRIRRVVGPHDHVAWCLRRLYTELFTVGLWRYAIKRDSAKASSSKEGQCSRGGSNFRAFGRRLKRALQLKTDE